MELADQEWHVKLHEQIRLYWVIALQSFVKYMEESNDEITNKVILNNDPQVIYKKSHDPSLILRYKILTRDNYSCKKCGSSPAKESKVKLHIDHIIPWSKGGETSIENLETLCDKCNLGKSDLT